ncbi:carbohydrate esterase family 1 protein [Clohesyomyces aquaticus]|uniref:feruloyl esterase n=1 Tax=Clohesyomyces aquaticus TaxID=1231657 RepID=A0A1Y2A4R6_9PLEO|nr:carbohydrate esterase family 1 protein [Clohesyomyces aquaticus]
MLFLAALFVALLTHTAFGHPQWPVQVTPRATSGCGKSQFLPGVTQYRFGLKSAGKDRSYSYHLPSNYGKNKPYPVVIAFHGSSSIGLFLEADTRLSEAKFSGEKIIVYPNGLGGSWAGPSYHKDSTIDEDLQFVSDMVDDVNSMFCVDEKRVYATGFSNGGGFIGTLACSLAGGKFAAFASASGAFYTDTNGPNNGCRPSRSPLPMLEIHGGNDKTVLYVGGQGEGGLEPPISDWLDWWSVRNGCSNKTEETLFNGDVHHSSLTCGGVVGLLQHYNVDDMGHCWASTEPNISQLTVPQGPTPIQASTIIMDFFDKFTRPF